jgi:hypothetical protein
VEQIMADVAELAAVGVDEAVFTLHTIAGDIEQYSELLERFHSAFRAAAI